MEHYLDYMPHIVKTKVKFSLRVAWKILIETVNEFVNDKAMKLSAALAYYTTFSMAPMLFMIITLCGFIFGKEAIEGKIYLEIKGFVGEAAALQIQEVLKNISLYKENVFAATIGFITFFLGATGVFTEIQDSINMIWGIRPKPKRSFIKLLINRGISFLLVLVMGLLLIGSLIISALTLAFSQKIAVFFPEVSLYFIHVANFVLTFAIITVLFAVIFKVLPDAIIHWKDVMAGALFTAFLFLLGKFAIGYYLGHSNMSSAFGAAGSLILILVWVYYSSIILFFGAEFTQVWAHTFGYHIVPREYAVIIEKKEVASTVATMEAQR